MKRIILFFLLLTTGYINSFGQVKSVLLNAKDEVTLDSAAARGYAVFGKIAGDSVYTFKKFDFDGILLASGSFLDDSLQVPHGKFTYYSWITPENNPVTMEYTIKGKERFIELTGSYRNGQRTGRWISFYPDGKMKQIMTFSQGIAHGAYYFYEPNGKMVVSGLYQAGKKNGTWILNGGKQENEYVNDVLISALKGKKLREKQANDKNVN